MIKFAHFADVHLGAFRDPTLRELNVSAFEKGIDRAIELKSDFIIIAGDLFEISLPDMSVVDRAVRKMKQLKDTGIPIYVVYGSHDYSATETSIIDVLGSAGLIKKVVSANINEDGKLRLDFFTDEKTGVKFSGMSARKRGAEKSYYENLDCGHLENNENGNIKIFLFHSTLNEMKPDFLAMTDGIPLSNFPKNFDYYAGGHVHKRMERDFPDYGKFVFTGALFGGDYRDLENHAASRQAFEDFSVSLKKPGEERKDSSNPQNASNEKGGFYFVEIDSDSDSDLRDSGSSRKITARFEPVEVCRIFSLNYNAAGKTSYSAGEEIKQMIERKDFSGEKTLADASLPSVVLLKIFGELSSGKPSDINFGELKGMILKKGASAAYLNHNSLSSRETEQVKIQSADKHEIEGKIFGEALGLFEKKASLKNKMLSQAEGIALSKALFDALKPENSGETKSDYEAKIKRGAFGALRLSENV